MDAIPDRILVCLLSLFFRRQILPLAMNTCFTLKKSKQKYGSHTIGPRYCNAVCRSLLMAYQCNPLFIMGFVVRIGEL